MDMKYSLHHVLIYIMQNQNPKLKKDENYDELMMRKV